MATPLLSIAMIFRNDIRSIERCLKALQPLRDAAPCELVMADTGSEDGSRAIAEQYADILFDFPWVNDFSAARNAVMDRCSGFWCLILDTDEYLDEDVNELVTFLSNSEEHENPLAVVTVRNYDTYDMDDNYSDFLSGRIVRMSTGVRYLGAIHEHFDFAEDVVACALPHTILHHDGYVSMYEKSEEGKAKTERNVKLIRAALAESPDNLVLQLQLIESISNTSAPDYEEQLHKGVEMIRNKRSGWEKVGPPILRYAIYTAAQKNLPEWDEWLQMAEEWFPNSMFVRLDVEFAAFVYSWNEKKDAEDAIRRGNRYLKALEDYKNGIDPLAQMYSTFQTAKPTAECMAKVHLVNIYCACDRLEEAFELLKTIDFTKLEERQMAILAGSLQDIHYKSNVDTEPVIIRFWDLVSDPGQPEKKREEWKNQLLEVAGRAFVPENRKAEQNKENYVRPAYTLYLPLRDRCEVGLAATVMTLEEPAKMEAALTKVRSWNEFSIHALAHALVCGIRFPLPEKPLTMEEMDSLASRLAKNREALFPLALRLAEQAGPADPQGLLWARGVLLSAVRTFEWDGTDADEEQGMAIARAFARIEGLFLPFCYAPGVLCPELLFMLPPMHRFGWYCVQAFQVLDGGDAPGCVRLLHAGLSEYKDAAKIVAFLLERVTAQEKAARIAAAPPELVALANQVKTILARFEPDDPAVSQLKHSEAYQKVAWLIEEPVQSTHTNFVQ